ncbi:MAG: hypothetical protein QM503_03810 [Bacteroidota bacterium]
MDKLLTYLVKLTTKNTGVSSRTFALIVVIILGVLIILSFMVILFVDLFTDLKIDTDMFGLAAIITAVGGLIGVVFWGKVKGDNNTNNENYENFGQ